MSTIKKAWIWSLANFPTLFVSVVVGEIFSNFLVGDEASGDIPLWKSLLIGLVTYSLIFIVAITSVRISFQAKKVTGNKAIVPIILSIIALANSIWMLFGSILYLVIES